MGAAAPSVLGWGTLAAPGRGVGPLRAAAADTRAALPADGGTAFTVPGSDPAAALGLRGLRPLSRASRLACVAAADALAHPEPPPAAPERRAVVLGTRWGSIEPLLGFERMALREGPRRVNPARFPNVVVNVHAGYLGILFAMAGPNVTLCGPVAGLEAVGQASDLLVLDRADCVLAGGTDDLGPSLLAAMRGSHPTPGEGAALLLLGRAGLEGRAPLARLGGVHSCVAARGDDVAAARREAIGGALEHAGVDPGEVAVAWCTGADLPAGAGCAPAVVHRLERVTGACRAAGGALSAAMAAADAGDLEAVTMATAFAPDGAQCAAVMLSP